MFTESISEDPLAMVHSVQGKSAEGQACCWCSGSRTGVRNENYGPPFQPSFVAHSTVCYKLVFSLTMRFRKAAPCVPFAFFKAAGSLGPMLAKKRWHMNNEFVQLKGQRAMHTRD